MVTEPAWPDWAGRTVVILGGGPSLTEEVVEMVRAAEWQCGISGPGYFLSWIEKPFVIATNARFRLAPWADFLYVADPDFWEAHEDSRAFRGQVVGVDPGGRDGNPERAKFPPGTLFLDRSGKGWFDPRRGYVRLGSPKQHTGYQALHLAIQLGAARVILLGYDCRGVTRRGSDSFEWEVCAKGYLDLAKAAGERGCEVLNCTPGSAIECFRRAELDEVL